MQPLQAHPIYQFGDFELDTRKRVLVTRATGQPVDITGRVVEALVYLVERAGQLVEKKALMDALWPHVVVEDGNLTQTIHTLRRALGEKSGDDRYIATVPGRGYRFVAEVRVRDPLALAVPVAAAAEPPPRRPTRALAWSAAAFALVLIAMVGFLAWRDRSSPVAAPAVAVLPFVDMSESQDQVHFAEGLSEEILNLLARADALRVIARTSSFSFKDQNADIRTIAQRLAVTHVLEGSVRKSGGRVRITAQLIDAGTSAHIWSDTFDRELDDVFGVQQEIAAAVADALHVTLGYAAPTRAETNSTRAYEHYLQGRHLFNRRSGSDLLQAKSHFEQAVQIDPGYGRAWAALAGIYMVARYEYIELPDAMQNWRRAAERAIALSPDLAEAHHRAAQYFWHAGEDGLARSHMSRAMTLDPQSPLMLGGAVSRAVFEGKLDEALELQKKVVAIDPLSATNRGNFGGLLTMAGRLPEAQAELERALELSPASAHTMASIVDVLLLQGRQDEALAVVSKMPEGHARDQRSALVAFARGDLRESDVMLNRLIARADQPDSDYAAAVVVAEVYAARNDIERAFSWLDTARRRAHGHPGIVARWGLFERMCSAPFLKPLHADPRWNRFRPAEKFKIDAPT